MYPEGCSHDYISATDNADSYLELDAESRRVFSQIVIPHKAKVIRRQSETIVAMYILFYASCSTIRAACYEKRGVNPWDIGGELGLILLYQIRGVGDHLGGARVDGGCVGWYVWG